MEVGVYYSYERNKYRGGCACRPIKAYIKFLAERLREDALLGELCEDAPSEFAAICGSKMDVILASIWGPKIGSIWGPKTGSNLDPILEPRLGPPRLLTLSVSLSENGKNTSLHIKWFVHGSESKT